MFVAILVVMLSTGQLHTEISPEGFPDAQSCAKFVDKIDDVVRADKDAVAFASKCVEITKGDIKLGGKQA